MDYLIEEVFKTEGVPEFTFVKPPNFNEILVDVRHEGKPVVIEGQSGTGKTTVAKKVIEAVFAGKEFGYLSARKTQDVTSIIAISNGDLVGRHIIDDFHRLDSSTQEKIANLIKLSAEDPDPSLYPKLVIIGINKVGSELIYLVHDIAKRCGIHKVLPATKDTISKLIHKGELKLNVTIGHHEEVFAESSGDYWLAQLLCQSVCLQNDVIKTCSDTKCLEYDEDALRKTLINRLENSYQMPVKEFCRGKRFRASNDPYYKLLRTIGMQDSSVTDLNELANANPDVKGSINNIKERRLSVLLDANPNFEQYFYYNSSTKNFAIEDPALFYFLKHLDWDKLRRDCGFTDSKSDYEFDFAISYAGEHRELAKKITDLLETLDCTVFYDKHFESNYLGSAWTKQFKEIFSESSRLVVCLLDQKHSEKIWPTFERDCFTPRVAEGTVIPVFLDDTSFVGIPNDIVGIPFENYDIDDDDAITDKIVYKLEERLHKA